MHEQFGADAHAPASSVKPRLLQHCMGAVTPGQATHTEAARLGLCNRQGHQLQVPARKGGQAAAVAGADACFVSGKEEQRVRFRQKEAGSGQSSWQERGLRGGGQLCSDAALVTAVWNKPSWWPPVRNQLSWLLPFETK